ncbi:MAG: D-alanyl-D-alanine carboxypeptidase [Thermomicrobiales bacterium]|nr:D-alanyl-D-alanine carboxypeptidase [Thermomicrobiales bacterium]
MIAIAAIMLLAVAMLPARAFAQEVPELQITSTNYILIDADTGEIFAQRGAHEQRAPASLTKVFTAIETIEDSPPSREITTTESDMVSEWASQVGFGPGETFTVQDLLFGMMLPSGNDAARALARGLGSQPGDTDEQGTARFLDRINKRIQDMGLTDTHLVNPDGWGVPGHYSSAYDLGVFTMYALHYPRFVSAFSTAEYTTSDSAYTFENNNRMLRSYDGIIGGKTGYDEDAGWCLINVAQRDGNRMIAVTLNGVAPDDWYDDSRVLLNYGFEQKALRAQTGGGITGEIARYRDPDAATILAMASADAAIGAATQLSAPVAEPQQARATTAAPMPAEPAPRVAEPPLVLAPPLGAGNNGLTTAIAVAAILILLRGVSLWRFLAASRAQPGAYAHFPSSEFLAEPAATASD